MAFGSLGLLVVQIVFLSSIVSAFLVDQTTKPPSLHSPNGQNGPKGTPYGKIKGPKSKDDRILIVGAGPAGVHIAYKLKEMGFKNVTVFEKLGRVGGKSKTVYHRHVPHEMGTCYTQSDYDEVFKLVKEFDAGSPGMIRDPAFWVKINGSDVALTGTEFALKTIVDVKGIADPTRALAYFQSVIARYVQIHQSLFGIYEGELMLRPSQDVLEKTNFTFLEFLKRNDLEVLKAFAFTAFTIQGYGFIEEVPALYGLMWITPNFLTQYFTAAPGHRPVFILSKGFQFLWQEMVRQRSLDVRLYHTVKNIAHGHTPMLVRYQKMGCSHTEKAYFDFVITTPYLKEMIDSGQIHPNQKEHSLFYPADPSAYFSTTLMDTTYGVRTFSPRVYFAETNSSSPDGTVTAFRDSYATSFQKPSGAEYMSELLPAAPDNQTFQTSIFYQYAKHKLTPANLEQILLATIKKQQNMDKLGVVDREIWTYFPRYSKEDLASGILWDIFDIQGKYNMWYLGSSTSFESVKSVVEYNLMLLRNYDVPT